MTRYLLDTNIVSNVIKPHPSASLLQWLAVQRNIDLFIAALTLAELQRGLWELPEGRRRQALEPWFDGPEGPPLLFGGRILPFDEKAALIWARLMADGTASGQPRSGLDTIIAAVALAHDCVIVSDNARHFPGLEVVNPLRG